jgi:hypothetical protein
MNSLRHLGELDDSQANELEPEEEVTHMDEAVDPAAKDASTAMSTKADKAKSKRGIAAPPHRPPYSHSIFSNNHSAGLHSHSILSNNHSAGLYSQLCIQTPHHAT